jgi:urease accessory protein
MTGGDRFGWSIELGPGSRCAVVTQACEKVYRSEGDTATVAVNLHVAEDAHLDWLPQESILFDRARLRRTFDIHMAAGARLLAVESVLLGRRAMGEHTPFIHLRDRWRVWKGEDLIFADETRLDQTMGTGAALLDGAGAYASVLMVAPDAADRAIAARARIEAGAGHVRGGLSAFEGKLFCRLLARDGLALRRVLIPLLDVLRDGEPLPRLWSI